jgi:hypothetical protein
MSKIPSHLANLFCEKILFSPLIIQSQSLNECKEVGRRSHLPSYESMGKYPYDGNDAINYMGEVGERVLSSTY